MKADLGPQLHPHRSRQGFLAPSPVSLSELRTASLRVRKGWLTGHLRTGWESRLHQFPVVHP